jgi:hypothetical protein
MVAGVASSTSRTIRDQLFYILTDKIEMDAMIENTIIQNTIMGQILTTALPGSCFQTKSASIPSHQNADKPPHISPMSLPAFAQLR